MSKRNDDFFKTKKIWSEVKDDLLGCYLKPYFQKVASVMPTLYIDCFAGKGKFDDGSNGSPFIAIDTYDGLSETAKNNLQLKFIELNHADELRANISNRRNCNVISGKFEEQIIPLLKGIFNKSNYSLLLYVDPYGIKALDYSLFSELPHIFGTAELLINFNSFGFIREACRAMKVTFREQQDEIFNDLEEYDTLMTDSIGELNEIVGGDYWQTIINEYNNGLINCYDAEKRLSAEYKNKLRLAYRYVLDMPIRLKSGHHPKYRMIYATNHADGCVIMAGNIASRTDKLVIDIQNKGQFSLFEQNAENETIDDYYLSELVKTEINNLSDFKSLNVFLADFYNTYGVLCDTKRLSSGKDGSILKTLEKEGYIDVQRTPALTNKGKATAFWEEKGRVQTLKLRKGNSLLWT